MKLEISVIKGDGTGPEMTAAAVCVLKKLCARFGHEIFIREVPASSETIDRGEGPLPSASLEAVKSAPHVLLGSTGLARYADLEPAQRPEAVLMTLRRALSVSTNIRPVRLHPTLSVFSPLKESLLQKGFDCVFVRDLAGGMLCSDRVRRERAGVQEAFEYEYYNEEIVKKTADIAFRLAAQRKKSLVSLDKSNVLESSRLWRETVTGEAKKHPDISLSHEYIDNAAMRIIREPDFFDVIVTANVFGDIISDEGAELTGTPRLFGSAELGPDGMGIYTPNQLHDPDEASAGRGTVNPYGMISAAALMLRLSFGLAEEADALDRAVSDAVADGILTADLCSAGRKSASTREAAEAVLERLPR